MAAEENRVFYFNNNQPQPSTTPTDPQLNLCGFNHDGFSIIGSHQDGLYGYGFGFSGGGDPYFNNNQSSDHQQLNLGCGQGHQQGASSSSENSSFLSLVFSQFLASEVDKQSQQFLQFQNERLRVALQEQKKQQLAIFLNNLESKAMDIMRQKEEEIAKATKKKLMELQDCLIRAENESQSWQRVAKANEAMVIHLEQVESKGAGLDEESICGGFSTDFYRGGGGGRRDHPHQNREENVVEKQRKEKGSSSSSMGCCKNCNSQNSCMLFLPCKHLCSCKSCEALLKFFPVCESVKDHCLEVFLV